MRKNKIKSIIAISLALTASTSILACGKSKDKNTDNKEEINLVQEDSKTPSEVKDSKDTKEETDTNSKETKDDDNKETKADDNLSMKTEENGSYVNYSLDSYNTTKTGKVVNAENGLNVRVEPSINCKSLGLIYNNTAIDVIAVTGDWYKVNTSLGFGFVHKNYLKVNGIDYVYDSDLEYKLGKLSYSSNPSRKSEPSKVAADTVNTNKDNNESIDKDNKPSESKNEDRVNINKPSTDNKEDKPSIDNKEDKPSTGDKEDKPSEDNKDNKPSEDNKDNKPSTGDKEDKPSNDDKEDKPSTGDKEDKPSTGDENNKPSTGYEEGKPSEGDKDNESEAPTITANNITIKQNSKYSIDMLNIKAFDSDNKDITNDVYVVRENVNTSKPGIYNVTVAVKDSKGKASHKDIKVTVEGIAPSISASNVTINQGDSFNNSMLKAKAIDANGNDITSRIKYEGSVNVNAPGNYTITLTVSDEFKTSNSCKVQVTVKAVEQKYSPNTSEYNKILNAKMLSLVNNHRASNGVKALKLDATIEKCSTEKSKHMVDNDYFDHYYNGKLYWQDKPAYKNAGICAENIAYNFTSTGKVTKEEIENVAEVLFTQWKNSAGHNANMLNSSYTRFGFGAYVKDNGAIYATQEFGW